MLTTPTDDDTFPDITPADPPPPEPKPPKPDKKWFNTNLILALIALFIIVPAALKTQNIVNEAKSQPKCQPLTHVEIYPGQISTSVGAEELNLSAMAFDQYNMTVTRGVKYDWGISSTGSLGRLKGKHDLATFSPTGVGMGDLYVKASNSCTKVGAIGSVKVTVK